MTRKPYPFQLRVAKLLQEGQNVILQAPTGAGKTLAAVLPFLDALEHNRDFPRKCIYAVPMRVLANQFVDEYRSLVKQAGRDDRIRVEIQTGEQPDDRRLEGSLVFATIDQVLSSFLLAPYSLPRRLGNMNAGAVAASYLVFDEFHLFDPISTLPTTLEMLRMLRGGPPFLLMTATFSSDMLASLANLLDAVVVPGNDQEQAAMQALPSQRKTRYYHLHESPMSAEAVLSNQQNRTLVVCNVVDRARALYEEIRDHPDRGDTQLLLLHSRFLPQDRSRIERQLLEWFSKDENRNGQWILVATQVVEVGLDITCENLHTELAPANAILQRAGRCARYAGEEGHVHIYSTTHDATGQEIDLVQQVLPYKGQKNEVQRTLEGFRAHNGEALTFPVEQQIISAAHGPTDRSIIRGLVATGATHRRKMNKVMDGQRSEVAGRLVRAVSSRLVVVHDDPQAVLDRPFAAEAFSLHSQTVYGLVKRWITRADELELGDYGVRALHDLGDQEESGQSAYGWIPITGGNLRDVAGSSLVLVDPRLAGYDRRVGFLPNRGTEYRACLDVQARTRPFERYSYTLERYEEHVERVYRAFETEAWPELKWMAAQLESTFGWPLGALERAAHLVILFHDVGKLSQGWQTWVREYQVAIQLPAPPGFYAHTDYDPANSLHQASQRATGARPSHAVEGAIAVAPMLATAVNECEPLFNSAFTAIARHHGAFTRQGQRYVLAPGTSGTVAASLALLPEHLGISLDAESLWRSEEPTATKVIDFLVNPENDGEFLAYVLLARALRRSDQAGTGAGSV